LSENPYGDEFDEPARKRMVIGGRRLIPFLTKNSHLLGKFLLEVGPFFNPLLLSDEVKEVLPASTEVAFLENDPYAIDWLRLKGQANIFNINISDSAFRSRIEHHVSLMGTVFPDFNAKFDGILISQVMNYVDYRFLLESLYPLLNKNGLLFINNVVDYGIPVLFSDKRPGSNQDIVRAAVNCGFSIQEEAVIPRHFSKEGHDRLILVLTKE
jgi:hypothetical protein